MNTQQTKQTILVDFDGVIHSYTSPFSSHAYVADPPTEGAIEWLVEMVKHYRVAVFSSRSTETGGIPAMSAWLMHHAIQQLGADAAKQLMRQITFPRTKPPAVISLDDRAVTFTGPGSWPTAEAIAAFKPWNKQ